MVELIAIGAILGIISIANFFAIKSSQKNNKDTLDAAKNEVSNLINSQIQLLAMNNNSSIERLQKQISEIEKMNEYKFDSMRNTLSLHLQGLQTETAAKLEKIRSSVEEKLEETLEKRLGQSFRIVSEQLEQVHKGLGEMQNLATGVGDLKKVLSNVKTRGVWGEMQLENILESILTPEQYIKNAQIEAGSQNRIEFAVKIPNKTDDGIGFVLLPIDSKFSIESFYRLIDHSEMGNKEAVEIAIAELELAIKSQAKSIAEKYVSPPLSTDFAIMFIPIEALYAEIVKIPGIIEFLQRNYRVIVTSPTTITAILHSIQMGFRTMAIEKRSQEVWNTLASVKTEFGKFATMLTRTKNKLDQASREIEMVETRTRVMNRHLRAVETNDNLDNEETPIPVVLPVE